MRHRVHNQTDGFTLVEIMIVVALIALLAGIAVPAFKVVRQNSQDAKFINDLRIAKDAFEMLATIGGTFPADESPGDLPAAVQEYLPRFPWTEDTSIGGQWDWDKDSFGVKAGVSVYKPNRSESDMREIDKKIDNGSLLSGIFRKRVDGYIYVIEE